MAQFPQRLLVVLVEHHLGDPVRWDIERVGIWKFTSRRATERGRA